jgi:hypothetical protein
MRGLLVADKHEITFEGETFELQTGPLNELVLSEFFAAMGGADGDTEVPHDVMLSLLEASIVPGQFAKFKKLGRKTDDFWNKAFKVFEARMKGPVEQAAGHPTGQPSVSTAGPEPIPPKPVSASDAKVIELSHGRPDRFVMLKQAQEATAARQVSRSA